MTKRFISGIIISDKCPFTQIAVDFLSMESFFFFEFSDIKIPLKPGGCKLPKGVIYTNGAVWQEDDCTTCTCMDGKLKCQAEMCQQTCINATYVKGECCPRCNGKDNIT